MGIDASKRCRRYSTYERRNTMSSLYTVKAIVVLDSDGKRICAKYYSKEWETSEKQKQFEKSLWSKTQLHAEIVMFDGVIAVYKSSADVHFYVIGSVDENELILGSVLSALYEAIYALLHQVVDKRTVLENLDYVLLAIDELVDEGIILEADSQAIVSRVAMKGAEGDIPLAEQSISQALATAREHIQRTLLKG
ncbi:Coatomer subunit zeta-2 [Balamuthia mandrillaris]